MNIHRMHREIDLRLQRLASSHDVDLLPVHKDEYLNQAQNWYIERFSESAQIEGFEATMQRKDMFSTLVVKTPDQPLVDLVAITAGKEYRYDLSNLKYRYAHWVRGSFPCDNDDPVKVWITTHDKLSVSISKSSHNRPSYKWKRTVGVFGSHEGNQNVYIHTDAVPGKLNIEYVKYPKDVFVGGYNSLEFKKGDTTAYSLTSTPVDSEIPEQYHSLLVDIACYLIAGSTQNQFLLQFMQLNVAAQT